MYLIILLLAASALSADDLALTIRAQQDFDRIEMAAVPRIADALACVQSEAALLPVAGPEEVSSIHYRKGHCTLVAGVLQGDPSEERDAAAEFGKAARTWPAETRGAAPPALRALAAIAILKAGPVPPDLSSLDAELAAATDRSGCLNAAMPASECRSNLETGRMWRGWIAERQGRLADAVELFREFPDSGWPAWVVGRQALEAHRYADAVPELESAVAAWKAAEPDARSFPLLFRPVPDIVAALERLGEAQFLSGRYAPAAAAFDGCLERQPRNAWALFLRARAEHALERDPAAQADYERAGRIALAGADPRFAAGDAHFYRGVSLFQRSEYDAAEEEFATALTSGPAPRLKADVMAWWRMTAVAAGACQASAGLLEASLITASDFFPKDAARDLIRGCRARSHIAQR